MIGSLEKQSGAVGSLEKKQSGAVGSLEKTKWCGWFSGFLPCVPNSLTGGSSSAWTSACTVTF